MKNWDEITEEYLKNMPMNFVIRTGISNEEWNQAIRRVVGGWIYYEKCNKYPMPNRLETTQENIIIGTFVPEKE